MNPSPQDSDEVMAVDLDSDNFEQAGHYVAELRTLDELSTAPNSTTERRTTSFNKQTKKLHTVKVS